MDLNDDFSILDKIRYMDWHQRFIVALGEELLPGDKWNEMPCKFLCQAFVIKPLKKPCPIGTASQIAAGHFRLHPVPSLVPRRRRVDYRRPRLANQSSPILAV
jgi:hypothetical protein